MNTLNNRLRQLRIEKGKTQKDVAKDLGTTDVSIGRYEKGEREPKTDMLNALADYFNVSADYLLGRTDNRNLTAKDEKSIKNDLKKMMTDLRTGQAGPAFYGDTELDEEELDLIEDAMELALKTIKLRNKEKYTPKKYKKDR